MIVDRIDGRYTRRKSSSLLDSSVLILVCQPPTLPCRHRGKCIGLSILLRRACTYTEFGFSTSRDIFAPPIATPSESQTVQRTVRRTVRWTVEGTIGVVRSNPTTDTPTSPDTNLDRTADGLPDCLKDRLNIVYSVGECACHLAEFYHGYFS